MGILGGDSKIRLIVFGAHPDDCEVFAGGLAAKLARDGHAVKFVSLTNGDAGHHEMGGGMLARRRKKECQAAAALIGVEYEILDHHDGELMPTIETRCDVIRLIRQWRANMVITHRPCDYHPDHRYASVAVQDAAYMVAVPNVCPDTRPLDWNPFFFYMWDSFTKPYPFQPGAAVPIDDVIELKWDMLHCHKSQMYEWLPHIEGYKDEVPDTDSERRAWLPKKWSAFAQAMTDRAHNRLEERHGKMKADAIRFAECFEVCEYGSKPSSADLRTLFPF